tara:strand:+ start:240 stop:1898 length:1659 start_codon:yes stop_codon:yes gene_type:complete
MIEEFINIFEGLNSAYGCFKREVSKIPGKQNGTSRVERLPVTKELWENHLKGIGSSLGIMPVKEDSTCKWGVIDVDIYSYDYESLLKKTRQLNLPLILCRSKSGGAHLFLFITKFIPAEEVQFVLKKFAAQLGLADKLDRIYPMQTKFITGGTGSWLNLPYFNHEEGYRYAWKDNFEAATLEEFFEIHKKYAQENLDVFLKDEPKKEKEIKEPQMLPCIKNCLKDQKCIPNGIRNEFAFQAALFYNKSALNFTKITGKKKDTGILLREFNNEHIKPSLEEKEISKIIESLEKNEYKYKCKVPGIKKYCDASACKRNVFGITPEEAVDIIQAEETLGQIFEYSSVPPKYYMYVKVKKGKTKLEDVRVEFKGSDLMDKKIFISKLQDFGYFPPRALERMKIEDFKDVMEERIDKKTTEEATEEATVDHDFRSLMYNFLETTTVSIEKIHLLHGTCYYDLEEKNMHFRLVDLKKYLSGERISMSASELMFKIQKILKAKKVNGKAKTKEGGEISCPSWVFPEDVGNFVITVVDGTTLKLTDKNILKLLNKTNEKN